MKRLPFYRRPIFSRRILEVGGGHNPYSGITHAIDKYPMTNRERASDMVIPRGVEFKQGDLESLPFEAAEKFDFMYLSHVFEHVTDAAKAVSEINRVTRAGYLETPSPLREQVSQVVITEDSEDIHRLYCWTTPGDRYRLNVLSKNESTAEQFCSCPDGAAARALRKISKQQEVEALLPFNAKSTRLFFKTPLNVVQHSHFQAACESGHCAFHTLGSARLWASWPLRLTARRFATLRKLLEAT